MIIYQLCNIPINNKYQCRMILLDKNKKIKLRNIEVLSLLDKEKLLNRYVLMIKKVKILSKASFHVLIYDLGNIRYINDTNLDNYLQSNMIVSKSYNKRSIYQICNIENIILRKICVRRYYVENRRILYYEDLQLNKLEVDIIKNNTDNIILTYITNDIINIPLLQILMI